MSLMWRNIKSGLKNDSGATAIEYGLILSLMTLVLVTALGATGDSNKDNWDEVAGDIAGAHESVR